MNRNIFRVIFNKARGLLMVVGETAKGRVKGTGSEPAGGTTIRSACLNPFYFRILLAFGLVTIIPAHAQIVSGAGGPAVNNAQNGVPVVNINTPSNAGVSHNKYSRFDVQQNGTILNNGRTNSQTQLAGWIQGNPNLANGTARIILNEVNSQNPSHLRGYLEVAGSRAQVIVANPAGITCNGCGFINASRATMTTGTPIMNNGNLDGFNVRGGAIRIEGAGLDASRADYTDLIARSIEINAGIWANDLRVTAGANQVNAANTVATAIAADSNEPKPQIAIDVAHLGGMYANKIMMVGTEHGVGVRNAGQIGAAAGELVVQANGRLENTGAMQGNTALAVNAKEVDNTGQLVAGSSLDVKTGALTGTGQIASQNNMSLEIDSSFVNKQDIQAAGDMTVNVAGTLTNESYIASGQTLDLQAANIDNKVTGEIVADTTKVTATQNLTNRGIIDGSNTLVTAQTLTNTGTGAIFGDHVAIRANTLVNREEGNAAAVIAARDRMDIAANTITNREHALIFADGDMKIGGALDESNHATGLANTITNESATIEAMGDMHIAANALYNKNLHLTTERVSASSEWMQEYAIVGNPNRYRPDEVSVSSKKVQVLTTPTGSSNNFIRYDYTRYYDTTVIKTTDPAKIIAGGNLTLEGGIVHNKDSRILAGGTLTASLNQLVNEETPGYSYNWDSGSAVEHYRYKKSGLFSSSSARTRTRTTAYNSGERISEISLGTVEFKEGQANVATGKQVGSGNSLSLSNNSLFKVNPDASQGFIIETDPRFANYKNWISSDYMLGQLGLDPTALMKRIGDGFYEQKLVQEQVAELTGRRFLEGYASNEAQYQSLLDNGITVAQAWDLRPGVALTDTQVAQLTSDIVWLVEKEVTLPNGDTTLALVPQLYLKPRDGDLNVNGSLIAANTVDLQLAGNLTNQGTIAGREVVAITAENINNLGGRITGDDVQMLARMDINNIGGIIDAVNNLEATAVGNINVESTTVTNRSGTVTDIGRVAGLYITGSVDGTLLAYAGNDININGGVISNNAETGSTQLVARNDINLGTVQTGETNTVRWNGSNYRTESHTTEVGSTIQGKGDIILVAKNDINARGAYVSSESGGVSLDARNNINLTASKDTVQLDEAHKRKTKSGGFSKKTTTTKDVVDASQAQGTVISGNTVDMMASNNINVSGSQVVSTEGTSLTAGTDINITAATESSYENHYKKEKKSGLFSGGGLGITIGTQTQSNDNKNWSHKASSSTIGSVEGDVTMQAGNRYTQTGSHIQATQGDVNITAKTVDITEARETNKNVNEYKFRQSGISVTVTNPVLSAIQTGKQMYEAQKNTEDGRMKALAAATSGIAAKNAYDAAAKDPNTAGGIGISITLGASRKDEKTTTSSSTVAGSTIVAGNNVNITATGGGKDSDLTIRGSEISAGRDVTLKADNDIHLLAAANTSDFERKSSGSSAGVGVAIQVGSKGTAFGITANASASKGKGSGNDLEWTNTHVNAGNKLVMESGRDTNLIGAVAKGEQVTADVGRDLNIASLQDTSEYHSKDQNIGGSVTVGHGFAASGNAGQQKMDSSYASVTEQSGIKAGDEGFQIHVTGNTDLKGAVIASTDKAVEDGKNSLSTGSLTVSDIENHAEYKASSTNLSGGYTSENYHLIGQDAPAAGGVGSTQKGDSATGGEMVPGTEQPGYNGWSGGTPIAMGASDDASSTTKSGISGGEIIITNEEKQKELTGKDAESTVADLNRDVSSDKDTTNALKPIFNESEILAGFEITQAFGKEAGQFVVNRAKEADEKKKEAESKIYEALNNKNLTDAERTALLNEGVALANESQELNALWGPGGSYRQILSSLSAAMTGNVSGATDQVLQNALVNYLQQQGAGFIGRLVDENIIKEGSLEHAALHAIVGCAGAAASSQSCGSGAMGAASSSLLTGLFGDMSNASASEKEAVRNILTTLVTGIAEVSGLNASTANNAASASTENNYLGAEQREQRDREIAAANGNRELETAIHEKYDQQFRDQANNLLLGMAAGAGENLVNLIVSIVQLGSDANNLIEVGKITAKLLTDEAYQKEVFAQIASQLNAMGGRFDQLDQINSTESAYEIGKMLGNDTANIAQFVTAVNGAVGLGNSLVQVTKSTWKLEGVVVTAGQSETVLAVAGRTGVLEYNGAKYPVSLNASKTTGLSVVPDAQAAAEAYFRQLVGNATIVTETAPGGTYLKATTALGETYVLRPFSTTSAKTGIPEWTIESAKKSLPGNLKEMKFRGQ